MKLLLKYKISSLISAPIQLTCDKKNFKGILCIIKAIRMPMKLTLCIKLRKARLISLTLASNCLPAVVEVMFEMGSFGVRGNIS